MYQPAKCLVARYRLPAHPAAAFTAFQWYARADAVQCSDRCEAELAFDRQRHERLAGGIGQRRLSRLSVLRQRERARRGAELLDDADARAHQVDVHAPQRVQLAGP
jgi:hypothetical protein